LLNAAEAALEYEDCGRDLKHYSTQYPTDSDAARALFDYVRSESRILRRLLGEAPYSELLRLVRRHREKQKERLVQ